MPIPEALERDMTDAIRVETDPAHRSGPLSPPIVRATTFRAPTAAAHRELYVSGDPAFYQRFGHPTTAALASQLARIEGAEAALVFSAGMGAIATSLMTVLRPGDHVVAHRHIFAQTGELLRGPLAESGVQSTFVDARRVEEVVAALRPATRLVYLESPCNPWLEVQDIAAVAGALKGRGIELFVDGTFASAVLQKPLRLGATLVLHSATKYLGGHSDVMGGVAAGRAELVGRIRHMQILLGTVIDAEAAWLLQRGLRTLPLRVARQSETAHTLAQRLGKHPRVERVHYPGLGNDAEAAVARRQMVAGGGVVSFMVRGGIGVARSMLDRLHHIPIATSLGGVETVIELPFDLDFEAAEGAEVPALVRLAVGLESAEALWEDLGAALDAVS